MKTKLSFFTLLTFTIIGFTQNATDALRYSLDDIQGTARFRAMGGAFGALGGDLTAANINPAASAVFASNTVGFTFGYLNNNQDSQYFEGIDTGARDSWDINQFGGVFVFNNPDISSNWTKFSFGMLYDQTANLDQTWSARGINPDTSLGTYFLANAQGKRLDEISVLPGETIGEAYAAIGNLYGFEHQQAFLGYESFILDPLEFEDGNTSYILNMDGGDYRQGHYVNARGYNGKLAFNLATQYKNILQLGLNLNTHFLRYDEFSRSTERASSFASRIEYMEFEETLLTTGSGFSFQLGAILRATPSLRFGFNYASPTWMYLNDETTQFVLTERRGTGATNPVTIIDPRIVNIYPSYRLQTPWSIGASAAYVIGNRALLSFDYGLKDYSSMRYGNGNDPFFAGQNNIISNTFKSASSYRFGGEYKIKHVSVRGGYRIEESPYQNTVFFGDLSAYSFGLGYSFNNLRIDGSFAQSERNFARQLYEVGLTDTAQFTQRITDVIVTMTFMF